MGKMVKCKTCQKEIAASAGTCPGCGAKNQGTRWGMWIMLGLGIAVIVSVTNAQKKRESDRAQARSEVASGAAIDVTARELYAAYKANEVSADEKYRGKVLRVAGKVKSIAKDISDKPYVTLDVGELVDNVMAKFQGDGGLGGLSTGQSVSLRCRGNNVILGSPMLADCVVE